jgi:probable lipoprotein NlpC
MTLRNRCASQLIILLAVIAFFSSCGSRRPAVYSETRGAKAAEVLSEVKNRSLYRFITDWTGVRYRLGGLDKGGVDCSGFALLLNKEIYGLNLPRRSRDQADVIKQKDISQLKEGDLIFFSFGGNGIDHVGVYLNHGYFVHASTTRGVILDDLNLPAYQRVLIKAGPVKD